MSGKAYREYGLTRHIGLANKTRYMVYTLVQQSSVVVHVHGAHVAVAPVANWPQIVGAR